MNKGKRKGLVICEYHKECKAHWCGHIYPHDYFGKGKGCDMSLCCQFDAKQRECRKLT